ncbi:hypothetical protein L1049_004389 [Liquidambar formosana]|uniref:Uncharacterized protein n=1 Tax=Liquidambar formosana TaxID=63359 RepID=A0AAP0WY91_LIQFO
MGRGLNRGGTASFFPASQPPFFPALKPPFFGDGSGGRHGELFSGVTATIFSGVEASIFPASIFWVCPCVEVSSVKGMLAAGRRDERETRGRRRSRRAPADALHGADLVMGCSSSKPPSHPPSLCTTMPNATVMATARRGEGGGSGGVNVRVNDVEGREASSRRYSYGDREAAEDLAAKPRR